MLAFFCIYIKRTYVRFLSLSLSLHSHPRSSCTCVWHIMSPFHRFDPTSSKREKMLKTCLCSRTECLMRERKELSKFMANSIFSSSPNILLLYKKVLQEHSSITELYDCGIASVAVSYSLIHFRHQFLCKITRITAIIFILFTPRSYVLKTGFC